MYELFRKKLYRALVLIAEKKLLLLCRRQSCFVWTDV